jgi:hypothetical protein
MWPWLNERLPPPWGFGHARHPAGAQLGHSVALDAFERYWSIGRADSKAVSVSKIEVTVTSSSHTLKLT